MLTADALLWHHHLLRTEPVRRGPGWWPLCGAWYCGGDGQWHGCQENATVMHVTRWGESDLEYSFYRCEQHRWRETDERG